MGIAQTVRLYFAENMLMPELTKSPGGPGGPGI